eukprot:7116937-Alexandrium_andersonii.AAC.1
MCIRDSALAVPGPGDPGLRLRSPSRRAGDAQNPQSPASHSLRVARRCGSNDGCARLGPRRSVCDA